MFGLWFSFLAAIQTENASTGRGGTKTFKMLAQQVADLVKATQRDPSLMNNMVDLDDNNISCDRECLFVSFSSVSVCLPIVYVTPRPNNGFVSALWISLHCIRPGMFELVVLSKQQFLLYVYVWLFPRPR